MSRERARAREAREAQRAADRAARERARARRERVERLKPALPKPKRSRTVRLRRYGRLPLQVRLGLVLGWSVVQFVVWQVTSEPGVRLGLALLSLAMIPLLVVLVINPARRTS